MEGKAGNDEVGVEVLLYAEFSGYEGEASGNNSSAAESRLWKTLSRSEWARSRRSLRVKVQTSDIVTKAIKHLKNFS